MDWRLPRMGWRRLALAGRLLGSSAASGRHLGGASLRVSRWPPRLGPRLLALSQVRFKRGMNCKKNRLLFLEPVFSFLIKSLSENSARRCGEGFWLWPRRRGRRTPQRAVTTEPTPATGKRPAARRVFEGKAVWLCCSSVEDPPGIFSFVAPCHPAFPSKTSPCGIFRQALTPDQSSDNPRSQPKRAARNPNVFEFAP